MTRRYQLVAAAIVSLVAGPSLAQGWVEYIHRTERFGMMFPGVPEVSETTHSSAFGVVYPARVYSVEALAGSYSMTVVDYTEAE
ncbi:MAG: hypothetical protein GWN29_09005, partial [Gammaproteobacteria bacterium]|nr:hypothetical protein [Gammaproteobacteria bacterium]